jgi:hypothetical protein
MITPLNCGFGTGLSTILRVQQSDYDADTIRSIYCKDIDSSWFKMKSLSGTAYLEPAFYGLKQGDIITVEFDALALSGTNVSVIVPLLKINSDYTTTTISNNITSTLNSYYDHYKIPIALTTDFNTGIGALLNIRS